MKADLRQEILQWRKSLDPQRREVWSEHIAKRLFELPQWQQSKTVLLYVAVQGEVKTRLLIETAWKQNKRVGLPKVDPDTADMIFLSTRHWEELVDGSWGIPEPVANLKRIWPHEVNLVVVPGIVFNLEGFRLGYGRGFYDRFLTKLLPDVFTVGLAFEKQIQPVMQVEPWDVPVQAIITESRLIDCHSN